MAKILSGAAWVEKFPNSSSVDDLVEPFRANADKFIAALKAAGAKVTVNATLRPKERAYLMHWSFRIARENYDPQQVGAMDGVEIEWVHRDALGNKMAVESKGAAEEMVNGYDVVYRPVLVSRHTQGLAIDMDISWASSLLQIEDASGKKVTIKSGARNGGNPQLHVVGRTYGVVKLVTDPPHWSSDGH